MNQEDYCNNNDSFEEFDHEDRRGSFDEDEEETTPPINNLKNPSISQTQPQTIQSKSTSFFNPIDELKQKIGSKLKLFGSKSNKSNENDKKNVQKGSNEKTNKTLIQSTRSASQSVIKSTSNLNEDSFDEDDFQTEPSLYDDYVPTELDALEKLSYFNSQITREEATELLKNINEDGVFLIRKKENSTSQPYSMSLICSSKVYHLEIRKIDNEKFALGKAKPNETIFGKIEDLVNHFTCNKLTLSNGSSTKLKIHDKLKKNRK